MTGVDVTGVHVTGVDMTGVHMTGAAMTDGRRGPPLRAWGAWSAQFNAARRAPSRVGWTNSYPASFSTPGTAR